MSLVAPVLLFLAAVAQESETERLKKEVEKLKSDQEVLIRQLEVSHAQLQEMIAALEKAKKDKGVPRDERALLEEKQVEMARALKAAEDKAKASGRTSTVPEPRLRGKVTAVAKEIGLVVLSIGKDDGVREGQEYVLRRQGTFVASAVVDRADRKWSAAKITTNDLDPQVGDDAHSRLLVPAPDPVKPEKADDLYRLAEELYAAGDRAGAKTQAQKAIEADPNHLAARALLTSLQALPPAKATPKSNEDLQALRRELDDVRNQVQSLTDRILPSWKELGVTVEEASEALCAQFQVPRGLVVRRVRDASPAARILKPNDLILDRTEAQMLEVLRSGGQLSLRRRGKMEVFQVDPMR